MTARRKASAAKTDARQAESRTLTRRGFVTMVAAGSAVLLARPDLAAGAEASRRKNTTAPATKPLPPPPPPTAAEKEFDRQRAGTLATLKTLREHVLPPGGDLPVVFRPQRTRQRDR
jgi:hypothetical protein